jgi:hypothetical protein
MSIEGEIMTIHQKIQEAHNKNREDFGMGGERKIKVFDAPKISDIEEIKQVLQYILDKLHGMDKFMRTNMQSKHHREHQGQAQKVQDIDEAAKDLGLSSIAQLNETLNNTLKRVLANGNDSQETNSGTGKDTKQIAGGGSCPIRQSDFRAGNTGNPEVEHKDNDNPGQER